MVMPSNRGTIERDFYELFVMLSKMTKGNELIWSPTLPGCFVGTRPFFAFLATFKIIFLYVEWPANKNLHNGDQKNDYPLIIWCNLVFEMVMSSSGAASTYLVLYDSKVGTLVGDTSTSAFPDS